MQKFQYRFSGAKVRAVMERRGLNIPALARLSGMTTVQIAALLGGMNPTASTIERLADCLQAHPGKFFTREMSNDKCSDAVGAARS
jgi:transcriptional regulator with XRE-family HTH domain